MKDENVHSITNYLLFATFVYYSMQSVKYRTLGPAKINPFNNKLSYLYDF